MQTLSISQIFSQFSYYQDNYLSILNNPDLYYTAVSEAYIHVWPFQKQSLFLGDLLQLWFAEKWVVEPIHQFQFEVFLNEQTSEIIAKDHYVYAITGHFFTGENHSKAWNSSTETKVNVCLNSGFKNYCEFKALTRPKTISFSFKSRTKITL